MPTKFLKPSYESLNDIPEDRRDFYVQKGTVWELADENSEIASYFNAGLAANRDALRKEHDSWRTRAEDAEKQIKDLGANDATGNVATIANLRRDLATANSNMADLQNKLTQAKEKVMPEGHVALPKEKATALERYEKLGTPSDLSNKVEEHTAYAALGKLKDVTDGLAAKGTLEKETAQLKKESVWREAADLTTLDGAKLSYQVLKDLLTHPERGAGVEDIKFVDVKGEDEKMVRTAMVVIPGATEKDAKTEKPLAAYIPERSDWQPYLTSLKSAQTIDNGSNNQTVTNRQVQQRGTQQQPAPTGKPAELANDLVSKFNEQRSARTNPLDKQSVAKPAVAAQT